MNLEFYKNLKLELKKYPHNPRFLAVTKYSSVEEINFAIDNWIKLIWENRLEVAEEKFPKLVIARYEAIQKTKILPQKDSLKNPGLPHSAPLHSQWQSLEKHFIWTIQTKKLRKIFNLFDVIQSIWNLKQLKKIDTIAKEEWKKARIFLQFNISNEEQKSGFLEKDIPEILEFLWKSTVVNDYHRSLLKSEWENDYHHSLLKLEFKKNIIIEWIMWMASKSDKNEVRKQFQNAKNIFDNLKKEIWSIKELSIWMSWDYKIALEEGATMVRIGSSLFK